MIAAFIVARDRIPAGNGSVTPQSPEVALISTMLAKRGAIVVIAG